MSGRIAVVGIGPGAPEHITPAARAAIESADVVLGYATYLRLIEWIAPAIRREGSGMRQEVARVRRAVELAREGLRVALVSGGDPGVYGMAGLVYEVLREQGDETTPVDVTPGVSAAQAAAALLGAPLMTDFAAISLSDQLVELNGILERLELAARADLVLCLYNPAGRRRTEPFRLACDILSRHRRPDTPVGIVRDAYRDEQAVEIVSLSDLPRATVDMTTVVLIGNSRTFVHNGKMITPRGYRDRYDLGAAGERRENDASPRD